MTIEKIKVSAIKVDLSMRESVLDAYNQIKKMDFNKNKMAIHCSANGAGIALYDKLKHEGYLVIGVQRLNSSTQ